MGALLTAAEMTRMRALRTAALRRRFVAAHAFLRCVLAEYLGIQPSLVPLRAEPGEKPSLTGRDAAGTGLQFNMTHAREHALCAVAEGITVGVDLEWIDARIEHDELADFLAREEVEALRRLPPAERRGAFFTTWTRKEAYLKALGTGLALPLSDFAVSVGEAAPRITRPAAPGGQWTVVDLGAPEGYVASLVAGAPAVSVRRRSWALSPLDGAPSSA
jgi:4'-phosphopantetheinyl transferase